MYESSIQSTILAEARNRGGVIQKGSVGNSHISWFDSLDIHKRLTRFLRILYKKKQCHPGVKVTDTQQNEGKMTLRAISQVQKPKRMGLQLPCEGEKMRLSQKAQRGIRQNTEFRASSLGLET